MSVVRQFLGILFLLCVLWFLIAVGIPVAVHVAAILTPTSVPGYAWDTPALVGQAIKGTPFPASTQGCLIGLVILTVLLLVILSSAGLRFTPNGRASILRLRFYVWRKSRPRRAPLTARAAAPLGRVGWFGFFGIRWFTDMLEEMRVMIAPSGAGKTVRLVVQLIHRSRGPLLTTSTKTDVLRLTGWIRQYRYPDSKVQSFDPEGLVPWANRVKWNIVDGCQDGQMAVKRAAAIVATRPTNNNESTNSGFFTLAVTIVLQCMLHAAAVKNLNMRDVMRWMNDSTDDTPYQILREEPGAIHHWEALLIRYCRGKAGETVSSMEMSASGILNSFAIDTILDAVCPDADDVVFDSTNFHNTTDTLYLICKGEDSPAAPVFTALTESIYLAASDAATRNGPLTPPLELILDEAMNVCPIPSLARAMSTGRGEGISVTVILQDYSQVVSKYGQSVSTTIVNNATELMILGGLKDADYLQNVALIAGSLAGGRSGRDGQVMAPDKIRTLRDGRALFFYRNLPPAILTLPAWWKSGHKNDYEKSLKWADQLQKNYNDNLTSGVETADTVIEKSIAHEQEAY